MSIILNGNKYEHKKNILSAKHSPFQFQKSHLTFKKIFFKDPGYISFQVAILLNRDLKKLPDF